MYTVLTVIPLGAKGYGVFQMARISAAAYALWRVVISCALTVGCQELAYKLAILRHAVSKAEGLVFPVRTQLIKGGIQLLEQLLVAGAHGGADIYAEGIALLVPVHKAEVQRKPAGLVGRVKAHRLPVYLHLEGSIKALYRKAVLLGEVQLCHKAQQHLYGIFAALGHGGVGRYTCCGDP